MRGTGAGVSILGILFFFIVIFPFMLNNISEVTDKGREMREGKEITIYETHYQVST